ncbi:Der1-like (degradation in the ER) family [Schizosaccharomyces osmophilus]|uniref:Derlin n=1 Tax=Schizosaccharomyces osmophilus TaxID=2545709 RepID=A0AAE9WBE0_9SCHI|nr:Der1-like (degradation in the ER) family [Schizosaccharomyces osmophilus]WBW72534.1 Der1-like (degradation in the ER) family [Schizosaccharomyces osmophilus]
MAILPEFIRQTPPVTRYLVFGTLLTTLAVNFGYLSELRVFFNWKLFLFKGEYWRAITTFLYIGPLSLESILYLSFLLRFMSMLEEASPPPRTKNFLKTLSIICGSLLVMTYFFHMPFAASYFSFSMLYIWSWKHPLYRVSILGLFDVKAPYVPWVMVLLRWFRSGSFPVLDLMSALIGHTYFFLNDFAAI